MIKKSYFMLILTSIISLNVMTASAALKLDDLNRLDSFVTKSKTTKPLNLANTDLRHKDFDSLEEANMSGSNFKGCNFSGSPHQRKILRNIDFSNCNLTNANFSHTEIISCKFKNAELSRANFTDAKIVHSKFYDSRLENAVFDKTDQESVGFDRSDLRCSSWKDGKLYRVSFLRADERGMKKDSLSETDCSHENVIKSGFFETYHCPCGS